MRPQYDQYGQQAQQPIQGETAQTQPMMAPPQYQWQQPMQQQPMTWAEIKKNWGIGTQQQGSVGAATSPGMPAHESPDAVHTAASGGTAGA